MALRPVKTSADAHKLSELVNTLLNKDLKNHMKNSVDKMSKYSHFVCSDAISPLNPLLGVMNTLIYVFLEETPMANFSRVDECRQLVVDYLTSPMKLNIMSVNCLMNFTSVDNRFWVTLSMHYSEKCSHMIDCIVSEGINPSQRYNGLLFTRQIGNSYASGHPSMCLLEDYRKQFISIPGDVNIYKSYFEPSSVPDLASAEGVGVSICFTNHQDMYSADELASVPVVVNDVKGQAPLFAVANLADGEYCTMSCPRTLRGHVLVDY